MLVLPIIFVLVLVLVHEDIIAVVYCAKTLWLKKLIFKKTWSISSQMLGRILHIVWLARQYLQWKDQGA